MLDTELIRKINSRFDLLDEDHDGLLTFDEITMVAPEAAPGTVDGKSTELPAQRVDCATPQVPVSSKEVELVVMADYEASLPGPGPEPEPEPAMPKLPALPGAELRTLLEEPAPKLPF